MAIVYASIRQLDCAVAKSKSQHSSACESACFPSRNSHRNSLKSANSYGSSCILLRLYSARHSAISICKIIKVHCPQVPLAFFFSYGQKKITLLSTMILSTGKNCL